MVFPLAVSLVFLFFPSPKEQHVCVWDYNNFGTSFSSACHAGQQLADEQLSLHLLVYARRRCGRTGRMLHVPLARSAPPEPATSAPRFGMSPPNPPPRKSSGGTYSLPQPSPDHPNLQFGEGWGGELAASHLCLRRLWLILELTSLLRHPHLQIEE